jgi:hypothetical protein
MGSLPAALSLGLFAHCSEDQPHLQMVVSHKEVGEKKDMRSFKEVVFRAVLVYMMPKKSGEKLIRRLVHLHRLRVGFFLVKFFCFGLLLHPSAVEIPDLHRILPEYLQPFIFFEDYFQIGLIQRGGALILRRRSCGSAALEGQKRTQKKK